MQKIGVISSDIIKSSQFDDAALRDAMHALNKRETPNFQVEEMLISRGDSLQFMQLNWEQTFMYSIYLKAYFKRQELQLKKGSKTASPDLRIALSVGTVNAIPDNIGNTLEEPFVISGRALDAMKTKKQSIIIATNREELNKELELECAFLQQIIDGWSVAQAEVIYYLVQEYKQKEIAEILELTQPSVSNRIQLANWGLIRKMNDRFLELMNIV